MIAVSEPPDTVYVVQAGDTLSGIAEQFYGNYSDWPVIYDANRDLIQDPNLIYAGWRLGIPARHASVNVLTGDTDYVPRHSNGKFSGTLSCSGLEMLWDYAGGNPAVAFIAAEIAEAESGGRQYATGPVGEKGYWQINPDHGALSTYDPVGNAKAAILISDDGKNWTPWTTYVSGAYIGRC